MSKKVLITGVMGGLGQALAREFHQLGHKVIGLDQLKEAKESMAFVDYHQCDLNSRDAWKQKLEWLFEKYHIPEIIIHNAGITSLDAFLDEGDQRFNQVMEVNFHSIVTSIRFWLTKMSPHHETTLVNIASMAGHIPPAGMVSYSASKHALVGFTRSLQLEMETLGLRAKLILVSPGFIKTDIMKIGQKKGFPKELDFLVGSVEKNAQLIAYKIIQGESFIVPDMSGKVMGLMQRLSPSLVKVANSYLSKKIHKD